MADEEKRDKFTLMKEQIERHEDIPDERSVDVRERDVNEIIRRLREKEEKPVITNINEKIVNIKERVEGSGSVVKMGMRDFSVFSTTISNTSAKGLSFIGGIYNAFRGPLTKLTNLVASIPLSQGLKENLDSAGISWSPEEYLVILSTGAAIVFALVLFIFGSVSVGFNDVSLSLLAPFVALSAAILVVIVGLIYPSALANERATKLNKELPFALRQLATQIKAGVSFHKAMSSIVNSKYGALSDEFHKVLMDIERGSSTEQALLKLAAKTKSRGLKKAIVQILRALKSGGNLSETITAIADDVSFELRMKVRDFTEKLNFISVIYIMIGVVGPVVMVILSSIAQLPLLGANFPFEYVVMAFAGVTGVMVMLLFIIKRMEPA
ncbi:MAG TPA: type II secretion system F family protein [Candidatus Norongarragalinales archaeon]|nr:type II secretion system F family protein [Candidatus Norongarragalinales archaeon]